ncbi:DUF3885 domain-containing protein [Paenibacillus sp. FSL R7-0331]|uniref:DUF3885 domain-containing protein n=1 Tax=Paenibacillus sp. FSL R7-0331 TaxID=1536773 RepID=UPI000693BB69|nr:DUF3885 domain-containing protein [Paenibacillus sp. FSL R7-0331]
MNIVKELTAHALYIRFELGLESLMDETYRREGLHRANLICRSIFDPEDHVVFLHHTSFSRNDKRVSTVRLKRFFKTRLKQISSSILPYAFDESDTDLYTFERKAQIKAKEIRIPYVLECIGNIDFRRKPEAGGQIYLYNKTKGILFHMYDDRGCDVYSSGRDVLLPLYHKHRNWILDYNRYTIDNFFGEGLAGIIETEEEQKARREFNSKKITHSGINLRRTNTCKIIHHFEIPSVNAATFAKELAFTTFEIRLISKTDRTVTFTAVKTEALAQIDYQSHLMSMYGKKYGGYIGWSYEKV